MLEPDINSKKNVHTLDFNTLVFTNFDFPTLNFSDWSKVCLVLYVFLRQNNL